MRKALKPGWEKMAVELRFKVDVLVPVNGSRDQRIRIKMLTKPSVRYEA